MKKITLTITLLLATCSLVTTASACGGITNNKTETMTQKRKLASDDAQVQRTDKDLATRVINKGTKVNIHFGDVVIPATLGNTSAAKALVAKLPLQVSVSRYDFDLCGTMGQRLPYKDEEKRYGWLNGDINFVPDGGWFTILMGHEEESESYGEHVNLGKVDCKLSEVKKLHGSYRILIELAD